MRRLSLDPDSHDRGDLLADLRRLVFATRCAVGIEALVWLTTSAGCRAMP
jgi:hypothetical protein